MNVLFICIGNVNRSRAAEAILKSKNISNIDVKSRGLLLSTDDRPMTPEMYQTLSEEEKKYVSPKAEPLELSDLNWADVVYIMDYYVLDLLCTRFSPYYWESKLKFYTQDTKEFEPFIPIKDPYKTGDFNKAYNDLNQYLGNIINFITK